ncbi:hypothetical protein IscW_ISCW023437 [Ixodes scapularis]|uniref:Uncharacterized protein n=1 Tax=Ixodes scapularis TaxID=6945 RepID=B7QIH3_IXOSC|nr:hypothetical protein IscW_ISCW023437 [Ixodes scapularis]|eukprot:XP_002414980.1 hypothetical protein IscW_ISCW023437 [Ixodes scapularis]
MCFSAAFGNFPGGDLLFNLKGKWWKTPIPRVPASLGKCQLSANASSSGSNSEMSLSSGGGVSIVLFVGSLAGAVIGLGEFFWDLQKFPSGERESIIAEMFHACKLVVTCRGRKFSPISPSLEASLDGDAALRSTPQSSTKS